MAVRFTAAPTSRPTIATGRPSFRKILLAIADAYRERRDEVLKSADEAMHMLAGAEGFAGRHDGVFAAYRRHHGAVGAAYLRREERRLRQCARSFRIRPRLTC